MIDLSKTKLGGAIMREYSLLLPGQGSQYVGMGKKLYDRYSFIQGIYEEANEILGINIRDLCFYGDITELTQTVNTQPAIFLTEIAAYNILIHEFEEKPKYIAGHSVGELAALTCSGAIRFEDAIKIVKKRGELMGRAVLDKKGSMAAVIGVEVDELQYICDKINDEHNNLVIANYNSYNEIVISGYDISVNMAIEMLKKVNARTILLNVSGAFHSPLMEYTVNEFGEELNKYQFKELDIRVISNVDALPYQDKIDIKTKLLDQMVKPVKWIQTIEYIVNKGVDHVIDLGPSTIMKKLADSSGLKLKSFAFVEDQDKIREYFNQNTGNECKENNYECTVVTKCLAMTVCTKNNNYNISGYEEGVNKSYREIQRIQENNELENRKPTRDECIQSLKRLKKVFITKKIPIEEQVDRFNEIFVMTKTVGKFEEILSELFLE